MVAARASLCHATHASHTKMCHAHAVFKHMHGAPSGNQATASRALSGVAASASRFRRVCPGAQPRPPPADQTPHLGSHSSLACPAEQKHVGRPGNHNAKVGLRLGGWKSWLNKRGGEYLQKVQRLFRAPSQMLCQTLRYSDGCDGGGETTGQQDLGLVVGLENFTQYLDASRA